MNRFGAQMLFTDPRERSPSALGGFGLTYACGSVRDAQDQLKSLLDQAVAAKLLDRPWLRWFGSATGHPIAVAAQDTYNSLLDQNLVIASDDACSQWTQTLNDASTKLQGLLDSVGAGQTTYAPPADSPYVPASDTLDKLKPLFTAGAVIVGAVVLMPLVLEVAGVSKMFRTTKKRVGGRR